MTRQQKWLMGIINAVGIPEDGGSNLVMRVVDMVEDLGADISRQDIEVVLREVLINNCCWTEDEYAGELEKIAEANGWNEP